MRLLLRVILFLTFSLCLALAAIAGATQRDSNHWAFLFRKPDGSQCETTCLLGVDLETMTFEEADLNIRNHPFLAFLKPDKIYKNKDRDSADARYGSNEDAASVMVNFFEDGPFFYNKADSEILILFHTDAPTVAEIIQILGRPSGVYIDSLEGEAYWCNSLYFARNGMVYQINVDNRPAKCFSPSQKIMSISLTVYKPNPEELTWIGFAPFERYFESYQTQ
jgi:hypothetical protein